ncbi:glycoside hydrolase family 99-like domain-containing protein [Candidatus Saccharibacteria bacterium]|nr:MAG: glycoside hydrolase family 99-like domain-containing protein [Candidatus Saccharibacteria bacterium]
MHEKIVKLKNRIVPIIDHVPYARKLTYPTYQLTKQLYKRVTGRPRHLIENNATDDTTVPQHYLNVNLAERAAEHQARVNNRKILYYEAEAEGSYTPAKGDPRLIAVYLPQFHKIPLNEISWGKGFTEWTNVASAAAGFVGQQQPILPADLGFYDLDRPAKIKEQIDLAKKYGIHGFMFYYYWFSGEKILNNPIDTFLENKDWDFNLMICWANENWTKRWDGMDNEIIIGQKYNDDDPLKFIQDVAPILSDPRYITIDGERPILAVYRPSTISNIDEYAKIWRDYFRDKFNKELFLIVGNNHTDGDPREYGFDALYDFSPGSVIWGGAASEYANVKEVNYEPLKLDPNFYGSLVDYRDIALDDRLDAIDRYSFPTFQAVLPHWDNHARKKGRHTHALINSTPEVYATWLDRVLSKMVKKQKAPLVFLNAWNEWAEGAMLEPTLHLGHANLLRTAEVLSKYSGNRANRITFPEMGLQRKDSVRIAVVLHLFYPELWETLTSDLRYISEEFDIFVTVPEKHKNIRLEYNDHKVTVITVPNWGRDVLPFLHVLRKVRAAGYEFILKLHSKKSKQIPRTSASYWLNTTIAALLPGSQGVDNILKKMSKSRIKIIGVKEFAVRMSLGGEPTLKKRLQQYYPKEAAKKISKDIDQYMFSAGSMFWARVDAFDDILSRHIVADDFELEYGQVWQTRAHFLERDIWVNIAFHFGKDAVAFASVDGKLRAAPYLLKEARGDLEFPQVLRELSINSGPAVAAKIESRVSIIITNYNYGKHIGSAIKSALRQTHKKIDILIVDDGSTDGISEKVIARYESRYPSRVTAHLLPHQGVVATRNYGLNNASGDYIIFLDADDILPKDYVKNMLEEATYGNFDVVYADMHNFGANYKIQFMPEFNKAQMLKSNIVNMSAMVRRSVIGDQRFDEYLSERKFEDWDFFLGLLLSGATFSKAHTTNLKYRVHQGQRNHNLNRDKKFWDEAAKTTDYIRQKYRKLYPHENIPG